MMRRFPLAQYAQNPRSSRGFALVIVLALLVLILGLVMAYFSRAIFQRQISANSASGVEAELLARMAGAVVLDDFVHEINAGSERDGSTNTVQLNMPLLVNDPGIGANVARSMMPQRVGDQGIASIVKVSREGAKFFTSGPGYATPPDGAAEGAARTSSIGTDEASGNGRRLTKERWKRPRLMTPDEWATFAVPDWIYLTRDGANPTVFSATTLKTAADTTPGNDAHVVGRYAYVVYDEGGLININTVGNALGPAQNARRGRLHQVSLEAGLGGNPISNFSDIVAWRWPVSGADGSTNAGGLFDPQRDFSAVGEGEQTFVTRQDLINYSLRAGSPLPPEALPFLGTFNHSVNAPVFEPDPDRPKATPGPGEPDPDEINASLLRTRFSGTTVLARGTDPDETVPAGTPVMPRRFPLSKIALLSDPAADAQSLLYYFGLRKTANHKWEYVQLVGGRIARPAEVAAAGREPNFFEILQAVIATDSLGKSGGDTALYTDARDSLRNLQVLKIGANIIDQWDGDDIPTTINYPSGNPGVFLDIFGTENLPYINQMGVVPFRPSYDRNRIQLWAVFDVWNPHQNASVAPNGISGFRIRPVGGEQMIGIAFCQEWIDPVRGFDYYRALSLTLEPSGTYRSLPYQRLVDLNLGRDLVFSSTSRYSEPTTIAGTEPMSPTDTPGLLLYDANLSQLPYARENPAVPAKAVRSAALQGTLNTLYDLFVPYSASAPEAGGSPNAQGDRVYPPGTTFSMVESGLNFSTYWLQALSGINVTVSALCAPKADNWIAFSPKSNNRPAFELQAQVDGEWITYQRLEDWARQGNLFLNKREILSPAQIADLAQVPTHHSVPGASLQSEYYRWRVPGITDGDGTVDTLAKLDPRGTRFGMGRVLRDALGQSLRSVDSAWINRDENPTRWVVNRASAPGVLGTGNAFGFEHAVTGHNIIFTLPGGVVTNDPDRLDFERPTRYADRDGVIRPADGYFGARPTIPGRMAERPLILNRPFRSVGELGYVFRDLPWKTMDFSTRYSGDLGLLDVFSLDESTDPKNLVSGKINLNTRRSEVLAALLQGSAAQLADINPGGGVVLNTVAAKRIADQIVKASTAAPFRSRSDLIPRVLHTAGEPDPVQSDKKTEREAAVRALAEMGETRTWNFLIDLVVQTGRFSPAAKSGADFIVQGEKRVWQHVAIDRLTGKVVASQTESIND